MRIDAQRILNSSFGAVEVVFGKEFGGSQVVFGRWGLRKQKRERPSTEQHIRNDTPGAATAAAARQNSNRKTIWPVRGAGYVLF